MPSNNSATSYGLDSHGCLVSVKHAVKGEKYTCVSCGTELMLRKGQKMKPHFCHPADTICDSKDVWRKTAKRLIVDAVKSWKQGGKRPIIKRMCFGCYCRRDFPLLDMIDDAAVDVKLSNGVVADVALLATQIPVAAVQIFVTHTEKRDLGTIIPWIDVNAKDIIRNPLTWDSVCESLGVFECSQCEKKEQRDQKTEKKAKKPKAVRYRKVRGKTVAVPTKGEEKELAMKKKKEKEHRAIKKFAHKHNINLPQSPPYTYKLYTCFNCKQPTLVYSWLGHILCSDTCPPPAPIPSTIQNRLVKFDGTFFGDSPRFASGRKDDCYHVNTCKHCGTILRDELLYDYYVGPFGHQFFESRNNNGKIG